MGSLTMRAVALERVAHLAASALRYAHHGVRPPTRPEGW
jgi:hypothetical protein